MKKIIFVLLFLIVSFITFAQSPVSIPTFKNRIGFWNYRADRFDFEEYHYANITFKIYNEYVSVDDINQSLYRIVEEYPKTVNKGLETTSARCLDEKNRSCIFEILDRIDGSGSCISIIYEDKVFMYTIR
jgi:hypothetical protein